jgi:hypothetical protein
LVLLQRVVARWLKRRLATDALQRRRVAHRRVIEAAAAAPGYTYTYKADDEKEPRIGPMADAYAAAYGGDGKTIFMPQMIGAMWTAMSAMARKIKMLEERNGDA